MSERRFVIKEVDDREAIFHPYEIAINESELRQRAVLMYNAQWTCADDVRIDILLHGEGEKGEELPTGLFHGPGLPHKEMRAEPYYKKLGEGKKGEVPRPDEWPTINIRHKEFKVRMVDDQPSPVPTREEWTLWAKGVANKMTVVCGSREEHIIVIQNALLCMPIIPKE